MNKRFRILAAILACALPLGSAPTSSPDAVSTVVALTLQAFTPDSSAPSPQVSTPTFPGDLYYLGKDSAGLAQVFRIERDARTQHQVTFEP